jgi:hypothetical protein
MLHAAIGNTENWKMYAFFYIGAVRYSSPSGSRCDSNAVSLKAGKKVKSYQKEETRLL